MASAIIRRAIAGLLLVGMAAGAARAEVERVEITSRKPCAHCKAPAGEPYEELRGRAVFALDPNDPANARIADLKVAPRDRRGKVVFASDFFVLRPVHAADSTLLYDVNNRGGPVTEALDYGPDANGRFGDSGFLARHGFTVVSSAWAWDITPEKGDGPKLVFSPPVAHGPGGRPITGRVANEFIVDAPAGEASFVGIDGRAYPMAVADDPAAVLTARRRPDDPRIPLPRRSWRIVASSDVPFSDGPPSRVALDGGFRPGTIYE
ncbi:MAG: hypothetical protein WA840_02770, partial [Caulobacteraceae bacterium]